MRSDHTQPDRQDEVKESHGNNEPEELKDYYQVLDLKKKATPTEIREAFFRLKNTYSQSNQALYSLIDDEALSESLEEIKEAYEILIDEDQRKNYDDLLLQHQLAKPEEMTAYGQPGEQPCQSMANLGGTESRRAFDAEGLSRNETGTGRSSAFSPEPLSGEREIVGARRMGEPEVHEEVHGEGSHFSGDLHRGGARKLIASKALDSGVQRQIREMIEQEDPSDGSLYKKIRLLVGVTPEEMQDHIKISVGYIKYLEENCFDLLPQAVYVKGFLKSYLRFLGVAGSDQLVNAYAERLKSWVDSRGS